MDNTASSAYGWALHEMGFADFNDARLTQRAVKITATFLQHSHQSIPAGCGNWKDTKAVYRFFDNGKVNSNNMLSSHINETVARCSKLSTVLIAQDTTTMNLSNRQIDGLGRIGNNDNLQGFFTHSALAMDTNGVPLGLMYQKTYVRKATHVREALSKEKDYQKIWKALPITEKETGRWVEVVNFAKAKLPDKHLVIIGDRESDIFDVFKEANGLSVDLLVRTSQNRLIEDSSGSFEHLFDKAGEGQIITTYAADVPSTKNIHTVRKANLVVRVLPFNLQPAKNKRQDHNLVIPVTLIDVSEENPPAGQEPIHWMLTTTLQVKTPEEAIEKVTWYMHRWRIERFHYILKTGAFNVEKLQFETFDRFKRAITLYSIVAWRILFTTYRAREHPDDDAGTIFTEEELKALAAKDGKNQLTMTIQEAVASLAKLGGYLGRKHDGPPGVKALWIGFQALQYIVLGMILAQKN